MILIKKKIKWHQHTDEVGLIHRCYHNCKNNLLSTSFWLGVTLSFPIEHLIWEKIWPMRLLTAWMGL